MCQPFGAIQRSISSPRCPSAFTNVDFNFLSFFRREANTQATKEKVIFNKGYVFVRTEEVDMLIVTNEDVHNDTHTVSSEVSSIVARQRRLPTVQLARHQDCGP